MSRLSIVIAIAAMTSMLWLGIAFIVLSETKARNNGQDILVQAAMPICAAPKPSEEGADGDEQVDHVDTKEVA